MIPLIFVLSLLKTVVKVRSLLKREHNAVHGKEKPFMMPPVIVLIENNFAYARDAVSIGSPVVAPPPTCSPAQ